MTPLPRRTLLALAAILDVAVNARPTPVASRALAERLSLPPRHLETILQTLVRGGLLKGARGPRGGYELARERRRISVGDVVRAMDQAGDERGPVPPCLDPLVATIGPHYDTFLSRLDGITFEALSARTGHRGIGGLHDVGL